MDIVTIPVTPFVTNCYVVRSENEAIVIDPGDVTPGLLEAIQGVSVSLIVNTHGHCDHCGGNAELRRLTGAKLAMHQADLPLLQRVKEQGLMFGVFFPESPMPDVFLDEGDTVSVGSVVFEVCHTPGHSPGHITLLAQNNAFVGDVLFAGSVGRTDLPGGDHSQLLTSIRTKLLNLPDETVIYPGHGKVTTVGQERRQNPFLSGESWLVY